MTRQGRSQCQRLSSDQSEACSSQQSVPAPHPQHEHMHLLPVSALSPVDLEPVPQKAEESQILRSSILEVKDLFPIVRLLPL
jgi:hypothetical protein